MDGRDGIVELLRERVTEAIDATTLDLRPWDAAMAAWARSYRAAFSAHPRAIPLLMTNPVRAPRVLEHYERAVTLLLHAGFGMADVMPIIVALENMVLGSALDLAAPEAMWEIADVSATPRLAEALAALGDNRTDQSFDLALEGFIAHARRTLEARGGTSG